MTRELLTKVALGNGNATSWRWTQGDLRLGEPSYRRKETQTSLPLTFQSQAHSNTSPALYSFGSATLTEPARKRRRTTSHLQMTKSQITVPEKHLQAHELMGSTVLGKVMPNTDKALEMLKLDEPKA
ncbi:MAG: hypothetical protein M1820_000496 [Bogoriella megaspora]|nr:MAG: hypothetical protein M1820_000496 [Bogoriella megaspora]